MAHRSRLAGFIIDCQVDDLHAPAAFWASALGMRIADADSLESVRIRDLGAALGVSTMAIYTHINSRDDLLVLMVDAAHSGRGTGRALGEYVLRWARAEGYRAIQFNAVVETNTAAVALWQSLGFDIMTTLPEGFRHPTKGYVGLHIMYRRL